MQSNSDKAMRIELTFEGGKVDDPNDPGGRTNQGVTQRVYAAWRVNNGHEPQDVFLMSADERDAIYRLQFADKIKLDALPPGVDLVLLDCAINSGPIQAVKWVQRSLAGFAGKIDGILGEATFAAIKAVNDYDALIGAVLDRRMMFLKPLRTWGRFGRGWTSRVEQLRKIGQAWATGSVGPDPMYHVDMHHKAALSDAKRIPSTAPGAGRAGIGGTVAAASGASTTFIGQIKAQLATITFLPHVEQVTTYLDHASAAIGTTGGILGVLVGTGGGAWLWYAKRRAARLHDALDKLPAAVPA